jgi:MFS family permease
VPAVGLILVTVMMATTMPTPLYGFWQKDFGFGPTTLTLLFSTYALGVLAALLFAGGISDQAGRRPVLAVALALSAVSSVIFVSADDLAWLFVGRIVSGLSAGLVTAAATAALTDLVRPGTRNGAVLPGVLNMTGLGLGPLVAGLLAEYVANPTVAPFALHLGLVAVSAVALVLAVPETVASPGGWRLGYRGLGVPEQGRSAFTGAVLASFVCFALLGLFTSLVPSFLGTVLHQHDHAVLGATSALILLLGGLTQLIYPGADRLLAVRLGLAGLLPGLVLVVAGLELPAFPVFLLGTVVAGTATGAVVLGSLATAVSLAPEQRRGQVASAYFVISYVGLTIPVVGVGIATRQAGVLHAALGGAIVLGTLALAAQALLARRGK